MIHTKKGDGFAYLEGFFNDFDSGIVFIVFGDGSTRLGCLLYL